MQIHELNSKSPGASDVLAMDDGSDTFKTAAANLVPAYTTGDSSSPTGWTTVTALTSGLSLATLLNRISTMIKNVRWIYSVLGTTSITGIGDDTVTGAISSLNTTLTYPIVFQTVTIGTVTMGANGYTSLSSYKPSNPTGYVMFFAMIETYTNNSAKDAFSITGDGLYLMGTAGATITGLQVTYFFNKTGFIRKIT